MIILLFLVKHFTHNMVLKHFTCNSLYSIYISCIDFVVGYYIVVEMALKHKHNILSMVFSVKGLGNLKP